MLIANVVLSLLGQQQQFHFAFGQRPFPFAASDPLSGFRMPPIANCNSKYSFYYYAFRMSHFGTTCVVRIYTTHSLLLRFKQNEVSLSHFHIRHGD